MISLFITVACFLGSDIKIGLDYTQGLPAFGYTADADGVRSAVAAAFHDNNATLLYVAIVQIVATNSTELYTDLLYDSLTQHPDDDFKREVTLSVLSKVVEVPGRHVRSALWAGYREAVRELNGTWKWDVSYAYNMLETVCRSYPLGMCKYAKRYLLVDSSRGLYPYVEDRACKEISGICWGSIPPEFAHLVYSLRKDDKFFAPYKDLIKKKAAQYLDISVAPAPDSREQMVKALDAEIATDEELLRNMMAKEDTSTAMHAK
jgi:hypothetical protein